jgi:hypothetical protein
MKVDRECLPRGRNSSVRYLLRRKWGPSARGKTALFVHLRPGRANANQDDAMTIDSIEVAESLGYAEVLLAFLFPHVASWDPEAIGIVSSFALDTNTHNDKVRSIRSLWLDRAAGHAKDRYAVWGDHGAHCDEDVRVWGQLRPMMCFGLTEKGNPKTLRDIERSDLTKKTFYLDPRKRDISSVIGGRK